MPRRHWDFVPGLGSRLQSRLSCIQGQLFALKCTCRELRNKALYFLLVPSMYPSVMAKRIFFFFWRFSGGFYSFMIEYYESVETIGTEEGTGF